MTPPAPSTIVTGKVRILYLYWSFLIISLKYLEETEQREQRGRNIWNLCGRVLECILAFYPSAKACQQTHCILIYLHFGDFPEIKLENLRKESRLGALTSTSSFTYLNPSSVYAYAIGCRYRGGVMITIRTSKKHSTPVWKFTDPLIFSHRKIFSSKFLTNTPFFYKLCGVECPQTPQPTSAECSVILRCIHGQCRLPIE